MLKRISSYADAALISFPLAVAILLVLATIGVGGSMLLAPISMVGGAALAILFSRLLHRSVMHQPLDRDHTLMMGPLALGFAILAALLIAQGMTGGASAALAIATAVLLLVVAVAMLVDAGYDILRVREHKTADALRVVLIGFLGFSWLGGGFDAALGPDMAGWVVGVTGFMLAISAIAAGIDVFEAWRHYHAETSGHGRLAVTP